MDEGIKVRIIPSALTVAVLGSKHHGHSYIRKTNVIIILDNLALSNLNLCYTRGFSTFLFWITKPSYVPLIDFTRVISLWVLFSKTCKISETSQTVFV